MTIEERGDMMMMVVAPTQVLTSRTEYSLWLMFPLSNLEVHQYYLRCVKSCTLGCLNTG